MSGENRDEALHRLEALLRAVEDTLHETMGGLTEQDVGRFLAAVSDVCRDAWECRIDDEDQMEWEFWPVAEGEWED